MILDIPSRELTYPTKREKENHRLKIPFFGGALSPPSASFRTPLPGAWPVGPSPSHRTPGRRRTGASPPWVGPCVTAYNDWEGVNPKVPRVYENAKVHGKVLVISGVTSTFSWTQGIYPKVTLRSGLMKNPLVYPENKATEINPDFL